ncbi:hypothetical protein BDN72DRAFT_858362 [Pluteus cervinus]|uniref:Uncharacterized protein n=1 Tax=Pluteus cervinus TaxID=181527 RepID=A0ACD3ARR2_9AGAR|nr:hypothetical protein BDN72DRAFT_858362 [Pluteus cervinus]
MADILGRKKSVLFGAVIMVAATIVQIASQNVDVFVGTRSRRTQHRPISPVYHVFWLGGVSNPMATQKHEIGDCERQTKSRERGALDALDYGDGSLVPFQSEKIRIAIREEQVDLIKYALLHALRLDLDKGFATIGITDPVEQLLMDALFNLWSLILAVGGILLCDRLGRLILLSLRLNPRVLPPARLQSQYASYQNKAAGNIVHFVVTDLHGLIHLAYSPLITSYTIEVLPFSLRAKAFTHFEFLEVRLNSPVGVLAFPSFERRGFFWFERTLQGVLVL